jgi:hypothetical protein
MKAKDIVPGRFYWYQPSSSTKPDIIRVDGVAERAYKGERTKFAASRFLAAGVRPVRVSAEIIVAELTPDDPRFDRIMRIIDAVESAEIGVVR